MKIITLCGSAKFQEDFTREQARLTMEGNIVLSVGMFALPEQLQMLRDIHKRKIDMSDEIFVINKNGYIGESTRGEIAYAKRGNKKVAYMESAACGE